MTRERVVKVEGRADSREVEVRGSHLRRRVRCETGRFSLDWVLARGPNLITVFRGEDQDAVFFYCAAPVEDVRVVLEWDDEEIDLDLHVFEPSGEECWAGRKRTISGGELVVESKGAECYALVSAPPGRYGARVRAFRAPPGRPVEARVTLFLREEPAASAKLILLGPGEETDALAFEIEGE